MSCLKGTRLNYVVTMLDGPFAGQSRHGSGTASPRWSSQMGSAVLKAIDGEFGVEFSICSIEDGKSWYVYRTKSARKLKDERWLIEAEFTQNEVAYVRYHAVSSSNLLKSFLPIIRRPFQEMPSVEESEIVFVEIDSAMDEIVAVEACEKALELRIPVVFLQFKGVPIPGSLASLHDRISVTDTQDLERCILDCLKL